MVTEEKKVEITKYFKNIDGKWCKIDTNTRKCMNTVYYKMMKKEYHIKVFGKRINNVVADVNIIITEEDKMQFYIYQMYDNTMFDK